MPAHGGDGPRVIVVGGGPAGLAAAEGLAAAGCRVRVLEQRPTVGRKFMMAGRGGLNLTHSEPMARFMTRYGMAQPRLAAALAAFGPDDMRRWAAGLGQPCYVGSSGRVFPTAMKASPLLRAWVARLERMGVRIMTRHRWLGWDAEGRVRVCGPDGVEDRLPADALVLATGGASWARLGADGAWRDIVAARGVDVAAFRPANCGFRVSWSEMMRTRFEGCPLHAIALHTRTGTTARGEAVITRDGIEGGAVYACSASLRDEIAAHGRAILHIDLRPEMDIAQVTWRLARVRGRESVSNLLRKALRLPPVAVALLREGGGVDLPRDPAALARLVKDVPLVLTGTDDIDRAISVAGGVRWDGVDDRLMLRRLPGVFVAGEMVDWEAPTGGYLLQACIATGRWAAHGVVQWLQDTRKGLYPSAS
ncbi:TIGR03862 family flavoprotein [Novacetimonas pomaceti]|uniref:Aminoacetone oxidase family FAD-binding enzyme n=1 Tax=Novacetimonas pomaceti TaxID=2021998 RepID=A0ABX5P5P5_9PROT|nr:TIGR03862 family flavoprotein [Novacetimonas pomaceti]PYD49070.1 aminoacetone oxidase family FAD-binding enzyme [Novacetimonas pomaceti]